VSARPSRYPFHRTHCAPTVVNVYRVNAILLRGVVERTNNARVFDRLLFRYAWGLTMYLSASATHTNIHLFTYYNRLAFRYTIWAYVKIRLRFGSNVKHVICSGTALRIYLSCNVRTWNARVLPWVLLKRFVDIRFSGNFVSFLGPTADNGDL